MKKLLLIISSMAFIPCYPATKGEVKGCPYYEVTPSSSKEIKVTEKSAQLPSASFIEEEEITEAMPTPAMEEKPVMETMKMETAPSETAIAKKPTLSEQATPAITPMMSSGQPIDVTILEEETAPMPAEVTMPTEEAVTKK